MLRIDDIPQQVADDIHAFGVIGMQDGGKHLNCFLKYELDISGSFFPLSGHLFHSFKATKPSHKTWFFEVVFLLFRRYFIKNRKKDLYSCVF